MGLWLVTFFCALGAVTSQCELCSQKAGVVAFVPVHQLSILNQRDDSTITDDTGGNFSHKPSLEL